MANVGEFYSLWLKPWHLGDKPVNVTVARATVETLHPRPTEEKKAIVLAFVGKQRRLILNSSNAGRMADIGGEDTDAWAGLVIQLRRAKHTKDKETIIISSAPTTNGSK